MLISETLSLLKLRTKGRIRGLTIDINNVPENQTDYFRGAKEELEVLLRHLDKLKWIISDIECASRYLSDAEKREFNILKSIVEPHKGEENES